MIGGCCLAGAYAPGNAEYPGCHAISQVLQWQRVPEKDKARHCQRRAERKFALLVLAPPKPEGNAQTDQ